jgi:hypothetical protein
MKKINVTLTALLVIGLTGFAYGEMGKCNSMQNSNMKNTSGMMGKDFSRQKAMMHDNINKANQCINAAQTTQDLSNCRMEMMQRNQGMMKNGKGMMQNQKGMMGNSPGKCSGNQSMMKNDKGMMKNQKGMMGNSPGKCNGNQGMMKNSNTQNQINKIKQCVNAATTLQEIKNCKVGMMQSNQGMMQNSPGKCSGN